MQYLGQAKYMSLEESHKKPLASFVFYKQWFFNVASSVKGPLFSTSHSFTFATQISTRIEMIWK